MPLVLFNYKINASTIVSVLQVTWVSEKHRIRKVTSLKVSKLEHLDNVWNRCRNQNLAGIHKIGTSNIPGENTEQNGVQHENPKLKVTEWEKGDTQGRNR